MVWEKLGLGVCGSRVTRGVGELGSGWVWSTGIESEEDWRERVVGKQVDFCF